MLWFSTHRGLPLSWHSAYWPATPRTNLTANFWFSPHPPYILCHLPTIVWYFSCVHFSSIKQFAGSFNLIFFFTVCSVSISNNTYFLPINLQVLWFPIQLTIPTSFNDRSHSSRPPPFLTAHIFTYISTQWPLHPFTSLITHLPDPPSNLPACLLAWGRVLLRECITPHREKFLKVGYDDGGENAKANRHKERTI